MHAHANGYSSCGAAGLISVVSNDFSSFCLVFATRIVPSCDIW